MLTRLVPAVFAAFVLAGNCHAADVQDGARFYLGGFGGAGVLEETSMQQVGTVFTPQTLPDINVNAKGSADSTLAGAAGLRFGVSWGDWAASPSGWSVNLATEVEGLYLGATPKGVLDIDPQALGTQYVTLPLASKALFANAILNLRTPWSDAIIPYAGGGAGYALVSVNASNSTNPSEPGINHFNSDRDESGSALALQAKLGVRGLIDEHWSVFVEYRHVYIAPADFTFGETDYPGEHLPTSRWNVDLGRQNYDLLMSGIDYRF